VRGERSSHKLGLDLSGTEDLLVYSTANSTGRPTPDLGERNVRARRGESEPGGGTRRPRARWAAWTSGTELDTLSFSPYGVTVITIRNVQRYKEITTHKKQPARIDWCIIIRESTLTLTCAVFGFRFFDTLSFSPYGVTVITIIFCLSFDTLV